MTKFESQKPEKIALYGGSFNPIHLGHINLALEILEKKQLKKILFCPANLSPFKAESSTISAKHRLAMLKLAIEEIPQFSIWEGELHRPPPSYAIDTISELLLQAKESKQPIEYSFLMGEDAARGFHLWHRVDEIMRLIPLIVGGRRESKNFSDMPTEVQKVIENAKVLTRMFDISSSEIRERLAEGKYCGHLLPGKVLDYIHAHRVYSLL